MDGDLDETTVLYNNWMTTTLAPKNITVNCHDIQSKLPYDYGEGTISYKYPAGFVAPMAIILALVSIASVVGNGLVVATIMRHRGMRTRTNLLLANLAAADILVGALDMPFSLIALIKGSWVFGTTACQFNAYTTGLALMASIHTLMFISIHKYISMTRPFSRAMTPLRISLMAASTWIWGILYNLLPLFGMTKNVYKLGATQCGPIVPCTDSEKLHSLINTIMNFIVPFVVMSFCNFKISRAVTDHMGRMRQTSNVNYRNSVLQQKHITVTLIIVMVCFIACWGPYIAYSCMLAFLKDKDIVPPYFNPIVYWCGYLNSACNPIIYAFRSPSFRQGYLEILCRTKSEGKLDQNTIGLAVPGSFYSGSASGRMKNASQRTYLSQYSRKSPRGIVSKAVMNHLKHRSQRIGVLKTSPSTPDLTALLTFTQNMQRPRMRRCDTDTCLLPTLTSGLDLLGQCDHCDDDLANRACSFHTIPPEDEDSWLGEEEQVEELDEVIPIMIYDENGEARNIRTESGAFVVSLQDENGQLSGHVRVIVTDADAISNTSLKTISRSFGEDLNLPPVERHRASMLSLMEFGRNFDADFVPTNAPQANRRVTQQMMSAPLQEIKFRSDPGGLALRKFGSVERLNGGRRVRRPRRPPTDGNKAVASSNEALTKNFSGTPPDVLRPHKGLLSAAGGGIRSSFMALFGKNSGSTASFGTKK